MSLNSKLRKYPVQLELIILLLAIAGGTVDTLLILDFNVLTGAQTGNTVLLCAAIARGQFDAALGSMISVLGYVIGVAVGECIILRHRDSWFWPSAVGAALIAELIPLGCFSALWHLGGLHHGLKITFVLIACAASAMGIQSAAMLRLNKGPTTTYITGTITTFATKMVEWLHLAEKPSVLARERQSSTITARFLAIDGPWIYGLTWFVYVTASVIAGLLSLHRREMALLLPFFAITLAILGTCRTDSMSKNPRAVADFKLQNH